MESKKGNLSALAIDHLERRLNKLMDNMEMFVAKFEIRMDTIERKINEMESAVTHIEDDYYAIKEDIIGKINDIMPYLKNISEFKDIKDAMLNDIDYIKKSLEKIYYILDAYNERIRRIEEELHMK